MSTQIQQPPCTGAVSYRRPARLLPFSLALLALVTVTAIRAQAQDGPPALAQAPAQLNSSLFAALDAYREAGPGNPRAFLQLQAVAAQRQQELQSLVASDPAAVLAAAASDDVRNAFPPALRGLIEQPVKLEGQMEVAVEDGPDYSRMHYGLLIGGKRLALHFAGEPPTDLLTGTTVRVEGVQVGDALALTAEGTSMATSMGMSPRTSNGVSVLPNTFGAQNTLVILVNFQDNTSQPFTVSTAQSLVFTTASNFWLENSFQQTWLTGDVAGWYTLPISSTTCNTSSIQTYAQQAAQNAGYVLSNYNRFLYVFPQLSACGWCGYSYIGGRPSSSWVNGTFNQSVVSHELGHALGLNHSHSLSCGSAVYASSGCTQYEYGDYYDTMANSNVNGYSMDYNAFQKERLGWLNYLAQPPITSVTSSGSYSIAPYETQDGNLKALKILQSGSSGTYYYVEFRQALGFDNYLSLNMPGYNNVLNGVLVHAAGPSKANSSDLLDMNPAATWGNQLELDAGQSYADSTAGITISPTAVSSTGATVQVTVGSGPCTHANPALSISPSQSQAVTAGATVTFTITAADNDSAACGSSSFNLAASVPAGWTSALGSSLLALSPGGSGSTTLQVTSPAAAANGTYNVTVGATNAAASSYTASASATYVISTPCVHANPKIAISPSQSQGVTPGTTASFTVGVTNNDNSACSTSSFNLGASVPSGWSGVFGSSLLSLSPGASASTSLQGTSPTSAASGSYTIGFSATNSSATSYTAPGSATYVIAPPATLTVTTSQSSYTRSQTVSITVTLLSGSSPVSGAAVTVNMTKPNGALVTLNGITAKNGAAGLTYKLKKQDPTGTYQVQASTSTSGSGATIVASTAFTVQ